MVLLLGSVCRTVACVKGICMPAKGVSVYRCDVEVDPHKTGKMLAEVLLKGLQGSQPIFLGTFCRAVYSVRLLHPLYNCSRD
uniref:Uncharacterized protein n=1 Tax=Oryza meridionalis TaxID=40149 RepID=A0A0E0D2V7_9ORYZ